MKTENRKSDNRRGSALILVVVVTVLLAVVGVMFLMVSRASELETGAVIQSKDLDSAVDSVVAKIKEVLMQDLFGNNNIIVDGDSVFDEPYDAAGNGDRWLASLEPYAGIDTLGNPAYFWRRITDLYGNNFGNVPLGYYDPQSQQSDFSAIDPAEWNGSYPELAVDAIDTLVKVIKPHDRTYPVNPTAPAGWAKDFAGARADADGDGVADSRWVQVPGLTTSRGEPVFAAIRIIDNCAMLNLNTAHCFYEASYSDGISFFDKPWYENAVIAAPYHDNGGTGSGRYLTEINYLSFLRGRDLNGNIYDGSTAGDDWYNLMLAKGFWDTINGLPLSPQICQDIVMNIENPVSGFQFFDIGDELELRNRYLLTSGTEAKFERPDVANFTLDSGSTDYAALKVPRDNGGNTINIWKERIEPANFDAWAGGPIPYKYDRRHVCTFYSYDRMIRRGQYPLLAPNFDGLATALAWTPQQKQQAAKVFWPVGPVTTNIQTPFVNYKYDDTTPSILHPYAGPYNNVETRRKILHLLFAFREYFYDQNGGDPAEAAKSAAQVVANLIDYSDDSSDNTGAATDTQGPFYDSAYGDQANVDCTFITKDIIDDMIAEVSTAYGVVIPPAFDFGLPAGDIVFGYEKQPFISEVFTDWDGTLGQSNALKAIGIEMVNPYSQTLDMENWAVKVGKNAIFTLNNDPTWDIPEINSGRAVYHGNYPVPASMTISGIASPNISDLDTLDTLFFDAADNVEILLLRPTPQWVSNNLGIDYIVVDRVSDYDMRSVLGTDGSYSLHRDDDDWKFVSGKHNTTSVTTPYELGTENSNTIAGVEGFQIGVADDGLGLCRWHELETLGIYGNGPETSDPNAVLTVTSILADPNTDPAHFDLTGSSSDLLDYIATINRPDLGTLPGRVNINTAPKHVIAAAIPPTLADPNIPFTGPSGFSALNLADAIVAGRPYHKLSDLLSNVSQMKLFIDQTDNTNAGMQSIEDDIEEEHWILSNLANKFTVRSDVFTAYILVRLGAEGPQRRMIAIFDRSQVWDTTDRPKLVALHPVPDPR